MRLPVPVAGVNAAILISSSFTLHWAEKAIEDRNRSASRRHVHQFMLGSAFLFIQIDAVGSIGFARRIHARQTIFYWLTGLHGAHMYIGPADAPERPVRHLPWLLQARVQSSRRKHPASTRTSFDVMWMVVYMSRLHALTAMDTCDAMDTAWRRPQSLMCAAHFAHCVLAFPFLRHFGPRARQACLCRIGPSC